jgi:threonine/homoserine/homoserine lactone efflux protein
LSPAAPVLRVFGSTRFLIAPARCLDAKMVYHLRLESSRQIPGDQDSHARIAPHRAQGAPRAMLTFALAVFLLIITPGPGVLTTAGFGAAYGFQPSLRYVLGLFLGTNMVMLAVITGFAAVILSIPWLRWVLMTLSIAYLLYLAARIAFAGARVGFIEAKTPPGVIGGLALQAINPKAYVVNTSLITGFSYAPENLTYEILTKALIMNAIWIPIHLAWLYAGTVLHELNLSPTVQHRINIAMALAMLSVVALAAITATNT